MKAKKSLIITLLAAVMTFALGATMAFAAIEDVQWSTPDYDKVTITSDGVATDYTNVTKTWSESDGLVTAALDWTKYSTPGPAASAQYYDLNSAVIKAFENYSAADFAKAFTKDADDVYVMNTPALTFSKPEYVKGTNTKTKDLTALQFGDIKIVAEGYDPDTFDAQKVTLKATVSPKGANATEKAANQEKLVGAVPALQVNVAARAATVKDVKVAIDEIGKDNNVLEGKGTTARYNGAAHTLVANEVPGFSVSYKQFNTETNKFDDVTAVSFTDAGKYEATVIVTDTKKNKVAQTYQVTLTVDKAAAPKFAFDHDGNVNIGVWGVAEDTFDGYTFVTVASSTIDKKADSYKDDTAAVKANEADLLAYFKEMYDVISENSKHNENEYNLTIDSKKLTDAEKKAIADKYKALLANFNTPSVDTGDTVKVQTNSTSIMPEIEFIDSPTAVTYKAKKLKKKAASFTVTAVASNNQPVSYKLIDAPAKITIDKTTGTITLAKKLKKGTYKIKVKAFLSKAYFNGVNYGYPYEYHNIKIKVKK